MGVIDMATTKTKTQCLLELFDLLEKFRAQPWLPKDHALRIDACWQKANELPEDFYEKLQQATDRKVTGHQVVKAILASSRADGGE